MPLRRVACFALAVLAAGSIAVTASAAIPAHDIPGSHDSTLVSRFPDSTIVGYQVVNVDQARFPLGAKLSADGTRLLQAEEVTGKTTRIAYAVPGGKSALEVFSNYKSALMQANFKSQFQCVRQGCGSDGNNFSTAVMSTSMMESMTGYADDSDFHNVMNYSLSAIGDNLYYLTARLTRPQGTVDVSLMVVGNANQPVGVLLQTVEEKPVATGEVTVNAKAMGQGLAQNGHIALYGVHFATDSAALMPDSNAQLAQMVTLLKLQPSLKVYIVGHTDDTGTLAHNLVLSQHRADAVVKALESRGIAASRMAAKGLASYAPVASNDTAAGRARNRRVELVKQ